MKKNLPNILTISRITVIPLIVLTFYLGDNSFVRKCATALFLFASITDFLDGYLARIWSLQSKLGRVLDPIADKLLVASIILMLLHFRKIDLLPSIAIICREILVSGLREFLAEIRVSVPVSKLAKIKTATQLAAIFILLLGSEGSGIKYADLIGRIALWLSAGLTLFTGYAYFISGLKHLSTEEEYKTID